MNKSRYPKARGRTYIADLIEFLSADDWDLVIAAINKHALNDERRRKAIYMLGVTELHSIDVSSHNAGMCWYLVPRIDVHTFLLNTPGFEEDCQDTLFHEIAHMIANWAAKHMHHGPIWKEVFADLGFPNGSRCHSHLGRFQGTTGKARTRSVYVYKCMECGKRIECRKKRSVPECWDHVRCSELDRCYPTGYELVRSFKEVL